MLRIFARTLLCVVALIVATLTAHAQTSPLLHQPAPAFTRPSLNGSTVSLSAYKGKVVLLNFWATWCPPCRVELPRFAQWQRELGHSGLRVIAVSMNDSPAPVRAQLKRAPLPFPVLMGDSNLGSVYGDILGLPVTFLIARDGTIVRRFEGEANLDDLHNTIKSLLATH